MKKPWAITPPALLLTCLMAATPAQAGLILIGPNPESGTGLGAVQTILTLQSQGQNQPESGCVGPTGFANCGFTNNTVQSGQSQVQPLAGIAAANIRIVFNASEPGNDNQITLNDLVAIIYNGNNEIYRTSGIYDAAGNLIDPNTGLDFDPFSGTGNSGYLFRLTTAADNLGDDQAGALQTILGAQPAGSNLTIGIGSNLSNAAAGLETFSLRQFTPPSDPGEIPEPSTFVLLGSAMIAVAVRARRKAKA